MQLGRPGNQNLFIGVKQCARDGDETLRCLPFWEGALEKRDRGMDRSAQQAFLVEQGAVPKPTAKPGLLPYEPAEIARHYGWSSDRWVTGDFTFTIYSPFHPIPDPAISGPDAMRQALLPAVAAELTVDNRDGTQPKTGVFAINFPDPGVRVLDQGLDPRRHVGFAWRRSMGMVAQLSGEGTGTGVPYPILRWTPHEALRDKNPVHGLGRCPGFAFEVAPGEQQTLQIALGVHLDEIVTTRLEGRYLYTRYFADLTDVLTTTLQWVNLHKMTALQQDRELLASGLSADQQFLIAHSTRSYYGNTQLLEVGGQPFWIVNEGEYCMMNTLDLAVDQVFWELRQNPWVVRNLLDNFVRFYSYHDRVKVYGKSDEATDLRSAERRSDEGESQYTLAPGGISFCHDMGVNNQFSPLGKSSYELPNLKGCFSYMTQEQLCNWILMAGCYVRRTSDREWARRNIDVLKGCYESLRLRDDPKVQSGLMLRDSSRCVEGQEITTYDSLDESLGQARNNLYLSVKRWAAAIEAWSLLHGLANRSHSSWKISQIGVHHPSRHI